MHLLLKGAFETFNQSLRRILIHAHNHSATSIASDIQYNSSRACLLNDKYWLSSTTAEILIDGFVSCRRGWRRSANWISGCRMRWGRGTVRSCRRCVLPSGTSAFPFCSTTLESASGHLFVVSPKYSKTYKGLHAPLIHRHTCFWGLRLGSFLVCLNSFTLI